MQPFLIDREQGGRAQLENKNIKMHAVLTLTEVLETLKATELLNAM